MGISNRAKVFVSYSHRDSAILDRLHIHLKPLEGDGLLDCWDDTRIQAGQRWKEEIKTALSSAGIAIMLLSADFLASDFIVDEELPRILEAAEHNGLEILMVIVKPCRFQQTSSLSQFQAMNPPDKPLINMSESDQESLWVNLTKRVEAILNNPPQISSLVSSDLSSDGLWNVPYERNPFFAGRREVLEQLRDRLLKTGKVAISGLGGIGKTQTAVEYAYEHRTDYTHVFWIRADSDTTLTTSMVEIARCLDLPEWKDSNQHCAIEAVKRWLVMNNYWLLVFDNVDSPELMRSIRLHRVRGHILLTSRLQVFDILGISAPIELEKMMRDEAVGFLHSRTGREYNDRSEAHAAAQIAEELGYLPLALEQAGAYIAANKSRFQDYLISYRKRRLAVLPPPVAGEYPESVATTWAINFREVEQKPESADLLRLSAFLNPDSIPLELIMKGVSDLGPSLNAALMQVNDDPLVLDEALEPLTRYSLIHRDIGSHTYSIHRIMQAVIQAEMDLDTQRCWAERVVRAVNRAFPSPEPSTWPVCERMLANAIACVEHITKWCFEFQEATSLLNEAGIYLRQRAQYGEAASLLQLVLAMRENTLGASHPAVATSLSSLVSLYRDQGLYAEAEILCRRSLAIRKNTQGPERQKLAQNLNTLAALCRDQRRYDEAEQHCRRAQAILEQELGAEHAENAKVLTTLAMIYINQGKCEEAESLLRKALRIEELTLGCAHHNLAPSMTSLASLYRMLARYEEAEALMERALALDEMAMGPEHPNVAWSLSGLADIYQDQGRFIEAEPLYRRALEIREKTLGPEHPDTARISEQFAIVLHAIGCRNEAVRLETRVKSVLIG